MKSKMVFSGKGNRKPQLDVDIDLISVDSLNPRLVPYLADREGATELDLISVLYENFDTEVVAMSLVENGYFDEEPIIIVPKKKPRGFSFSSYDSPDELAEAIQKLINTKKIDFTVVEGNWSAPLLIGQY